MAESQPPTSAVYEIPGAKNIDGLNLGTAYFGAVHTRKLDDKRLKRDEDILIATYPRTGTTWLCHIVSLLLAGEEKYEATKQIPIIHRVPYLEVMFPGCSQPYIDILDDYPVPRADKTHLPYRFIKRWIIEDKLKTIITTRHPKDTLVSMFHFYKSLNGFGPFKGTWDEFFDHVKAGKQLYGDQLTWMQDWDIHKDKGDVLFLKYEDMKVGTLAAVRKIAAFLDIIVPYNHLERLVSDVSIKTMAKDGSQFDQGVEVADKTKGNIVRKGEVGEWRNYFTEEQNEWFDNKYKQAYLDLGIDIVYD